MPHRRPPNLRCALTAMAIVSSLATVAFADRPRGVFKLRASMGRTSLRHYGDSLPSCGVDGRRYIRGKEIVEIVVDGTTTAVVNGQPWRITQQRDNRMVAFDPEATPGVVDLVVTITRHGVRAVGSVGFVVSRDGKPICGDGHNLDGSFRSL